jgi:cation/acetate symporter
MTTRGAMIGGLAGLISAVGLTVMSKAVWGDVLLNKAMVDGKEVSVGLIFLDNPAIVSIPVAFIVIWLVSILDNSAQAKKERGLYEAQKVRCETGIGAEGASGH